MCVIFHRVPQASKQNHTWGEYPTNRKYVLIGLGACTRSLHEEKQLFTVLLCLTVCAGTKNVFRAAHRCAQTTTLHFLEKVHAWTVRTEADVNYPSEHVDFSFTCASEVVIGRILYSVIYLRTNIRQCKMMPEIIKFSDGTWLCIMTSAAYLSYF